MKREKTIRRENAIKTLQSIDSRLKLKNTAWNSAVRSAFNSTSSFDFVNMAYADLYLAEELIEKFKLVR